MFVSVCLFFLLCVSVCFEVIFEGMLVCLCMFEGIFEGMFVCLCMFEDMFYRVYARVCARVCV